MARVRVKSFSVIRDVLGAEVIEIDVAHPETVGGLFNALVDKYGQPFKNRIWDPNTGEMVPFLMKLNEETLISSVSDLDKEIQDGDEIVIIFPIGGG